MLPHPFQILGCVDANGVDVGFDGRDSEAVLEHAQLLEALGAFEWRRRKRRQLQQEIPAIDVEPDVPPERGSRIARRG